MKKRMFFTISIMLILIIIVMVYLQLNKQGTLVFGCIIYRNTGLACPTCGFTDLLQYILRGNFISAFKSNQFMFVSLPLWGYIVCRFLMHYIKTGKLLVSESVNFILASLIFIGIIFGVLRNFFIW
ncbi:MAG: DUF2752 domain-containing protein [Clostridia bacterium]